MTFVQALFDGIALGSQYALLVLGFVLIYRATGIINFAQGGSVLIGAYLTYNISQTWGWNFYVALLLSMAFTAAFSILVQRALLERVFREVAAVGAALLSWAIFHYNGLDHWPAFLLGSGVGAAAWFGTRGLERRYGASGPSELPVFGAIMVTIGVLFAVKQVVPSIWGFAELNMGDPWALKSSTAGELVLGHDKLWTIGLAFAALLSFFVVNRYTKIGIAIRATHFDHEAAIAQGISTTTVFAVSWGIAGAVAALAGTTAGAGVAQLTPNLDLIVFLAFPAMILGGFDSPGGAVAGGLIIGVVQNLVKTYQPRGLLGIEDFNGLGVGFDRVAIFIVMIIVLMVRPYGLFGTKEVRRV